MGFFDRLFGTDAPQANARQAPPAEDAQALERYRYMLQTAPPETIEQAHQEAFAKLTPEQRRQVLAGLTTAAPENERAAIAGTSPDDTKALARAATRAEFRQPGVMERTMGGGMGLGSSLLSSFAMGFVGSMVANSFFSALGGFGGDSSTEADGDGGETAANTSDDDGDHGFDDGGDLGDA
jgi:hypothetical protein